MMQKSRCFLNPFLPHVHLQAKFSILTPKFFTQVILFPLRIIPLEILGKPLKKCKIQHGKNERHEFVQLFLTCMFAGTQSAIDKACSIIKRKFPSIKFPNPEMPPPTNPVIMPEIMQVCFTGFVYCVENCNITPGMS